MPSPSAEGPPPNPFIIEADQNGTEPEEAFFTVYINGEEKGVYQVILRDGDPHIYVSDLASFTRAPLHGREEMRGDYQIVSLNSLAPDLRYDLDQREITLKLRINPALLPKNTVELDFKRKSGQYQLNTGGFLNYSLQIDSQNQLNAFEEIGLSHDGNFFSTTLNLSTDAAPLRGMTSYTINEPETMRRLVIGDAAVQTGPLGSSPQLAGLTLQRTFALDPYSATGPRLGFSGLIDSPSTLEVYVNGSLVRRETLHPGTFELTGLRVGGGAGLAEYVIRDAFGREQRTSVPYYLSSGVLGKGQSEYTYSLGVLRRGYGRENFAYDTPSVYGRHRLGLTNTLTCAARGESSVAVISVGGSCTGMSPFGQFEVETAGSALYGGSLGASIFSSLSYVSRKFSLGGSANTASGKYSTVVRIAEQANRSYGFGAFASTRMTKRASFGISGRYNHSEQRGRSYQAGAGFGFSVGAGWSFSGRVSGISDKRLGEPSWEAYLGILYYHIPWRQSFSLSGAYAPAGPSLRAETTRPLMDTEGFGYSATANVSETQTVAGAAQYVRQRAVYFGNTSLVHSDPGLQFNYSASVAGAITVVPNVGVFATRPIQDAFALIHIPNVEGVTVYANSQRVGRTDRKGYAVAPQVGSYLANSFSLALEELPLNYEIAITQLTLTPPQHGLVIAEFPFTIPHYYRGTLKVPNRGFAPDLGNLRVENADEEVTSFIAEGGEFELEDLTVGTHKAIAEFAEGNCEFEITVEDTDQTIVDLGEFTCQLQ